jgi:hypothetical protein
MSYRKQPNHPKTLQRREKRWRAKYSSVKEVMFRQNHMPGVMEVSDYTWIIELNITTSVPV